MLKSYIPDQYFEAILQLRPSDKELMNFIDEQIGKKNKVFITKIEEKKFGTDIYLNSKQFARSLGNRIKRRFKGELITSAKLYSRDHMTSKETYRVTICFRRKYQEEKDL